MKGGMFRRVKNPSGVTGKKPGDRVTPYGEVKTTDSLDRLRSVLTEALRKKFPPKKGKGDFGGPWPCEITPDRVVFERDGKKWACRYTREGTGVKLGPEYEVEVVYRPVKEK